MSGVTAGTQIDGLILLSLSRSLGCSKYLYIWDPFIKYPWWKLSQYCLISYGAVFIRTVLCSNTKFPEMNNQNIGNWKIIRWTTMAARFKKIFWLVQMYLLSQLKRCVGASAVSRILLTLSNPPQYLIRTCLYIMLTYLYLFPVVVTTLPCSVERYFQNTLWIPKYFPTS